MYCYTTVPPGRMAGWFLQRFGIMSVEKLITLFLALILVLYGYTAFFGMDHLLPRILQRNPVWPSTFPKIISIMGLITSVLVLLNVEKAGKQVDDNLDINNWRHYKVIHAIALILGMVAYALILRPIGFIGATFSFLLAGSLLLGEKRYLLLVAVCLVSTFSIWYLVDNILGIYMSPLPAWLVTQ